MGTFRCIWAKSMPCILQTTAFSPNPSPLLRVLAVLPAGRGQRSEGRWNCPLLSPSRGSAMAIPSDYDSLFPYVAIRILRAPKSLPLVNMPYR